MKKCKKCWKSKDLKMFPKWRSWCKECRSKRQMEYFRTKHWVIVSIYNRMRSCSRKRWHQLPNFSWTEFKHRVNTQCVFEELYKLREESNFSKEKTPSVDRIDDSKSYSFENMRLTSREVNKKKWHDYRRNWICHVCKRVEKIWAEWEVLSTFHSANEAERITWVHQWSISRVCRNKKWKAWWYMWRYC